MPDQLTPAQKRAIRIARAHGGSLDNWLIKPNTRLSLGRIGLAKYIGANPNPWDMELTPKGWEVSLD